MPTITLSDRAGLLPNLLAEALAYRAEQFDGPPDTDLNVSGADLVDWFTGWRRRVSDAMTSARLPEADPYETCARNAGWEHGGDNGGFIYNARVWSSWKEAASWAGHDGWPNSPLYETWKDCCEGEEITGA